MAADDYAVVVGVQDYPGVAGARLTGARADAQDFVKWLGEAGVPRDHIFARVSGTRRSRSVAAASPGLTAIKQAFKEIVARVQQGQLGMNAGTRLGRRLYIFLAGHGFEATGSQPVLLAADADPAEPANIPGRLYAEYFREAACFDEVVLFMDCCRSVTPESLMPVPFTRLVGIGPKARRFYGFATLSADVARETGQGRRSRGAFTAALLDGLRGKAEINGVVTDESLAAYVKRRFMAGGLVDADGEPQLPELETSGDRIELHRLAVKRHQVTLPVGKRREYKITGKGAATVASGTAAGATVRVQLPNGAYVLYVDDELRGTFVVAGAAVRPAQLRTP